MPTDFERLYDDHAQALFAFLLNLMRNEADTRDVLQELFVKLGRQPELLKPVRDERSYLIRLAHNLAIDMIRRRGSRQKNYAQFATDVAGLFTPSSDPDEAAFRKALSAAVAELPAEQRAVVHLKLWEGVTFEPISRALGGSPNNAG